MDTFPGMLATRAAAKAKDPELALVPEREAIVRFVLCAFCWLLLDIATLCAFVHLRGVSWLLLAATLLALIPIPPDTLRFQRGRSSGDVAPEEGAR